ncbi:hypothetical protein ACFP6B_11000, partial [Rothia nasimurium]
MHILYASIPTTLEYELQHHNRSHTHQRKAHPMSTTTLTKELHNLADDGAIRLNPTTGTLEL